MNLFVGCSSKDNIPTEYIESSFKLLEDISKIDNVNLVFGAFHSGLMKIAYDMFVANNKKIIGIKKEDNDEGSYSYDKTIITDTATSRFNEIYKHSDVLLFLPGGVGSLAELFSAIEEVKYDEKKKTIILYNDNYFYTPIIKKLYELYKDGFIEGVPSDYMIIESDYNEIIKLIKEMN